MKANLNLLSFNQSNICWSSTHFPQQQYLQQTEMALNSLEASQFTQAFTQLQEQLHSTSSLLHDYYEQASEHLGTGKYIVNSSVIKQLRLYLSQITKTVQMAGNGIELFLLSMSHNQEQEQPVQDLDTFVNKHRDSNHIPLRRQQLDDRQLTRIRNRCYNINSIALVSNPIQMNDIFIDSDLLALKPFNNLSAIAIRNSNVSDQGLKMLSEGFDALKEIDISRCRFIGNSGLQYLAGYKYVSIKANQIQGIDHHAFLNLIATSYNLNYLQITNIKKFDYEWLLGSIRDVYLANSLNFKWLQVLCNPGTMLFVNKLAYLTHLTTSDTITDRQLEILLGEQSLLNGLYVNCCESLHAETVKLLIKKCQKLRRLGLRRFVKLNDALVGDLVGSLVHLQYLDLSECCSLTNRAVIHIANQLNKLNNIAFSKCSNIADQGMLYLVERMPSLRSIDLSYCKNITDELVFKICEFLPELKVLNMTKCQQITDDSIENITQTLTSLRSLVLNSCENLTDRSLSLVAMRLRKLVKLEVQWCGISQKCVDFISQNLNQLQELNLNYCNAVTDEAVISLSKYSSRLYFLALSSCDKISRKGFMRMFESLSQLNHIELRECVGFNDQALEHLCSNARGQLVHMDVSWCVELTDKGLLHLSQFQQQLIHLNLSGCPQISDNALGWLCSSMTRLEYLNLTLCEKLTDKSVKQICNHLTNLRVLYLSQLKLVTDSSVSGLTVLPNLEELHLGGCKQITSSSLIALLHNLEKLYCLNISECSNVFADSLILLVERMRNLKRFSIASLEVTDNFLEMVGDYMQKLQVINLEYCRKITNEGVIKMVQKATSILRVDLQHTCISEKTKKAIFDELITRSLYDVIS